MNKEILEGALSKARPKKPAEKKEHETKNKKGKVHMHIHPADSGGFHIEHEHEDENGQLAKKTNHVVPDLDAMHDHMEATYGQDQPNEGEEEAMNQAEANAPQQE